MLEELLKNLGAAIPKLAAALALVLIGYIIAKVVRRVVTALLSKIGIDSLAEKLNDIDLVQQYNVQIKPSVIVGSVVYYVLMLISLIAATDTLGMPAISNLVKDIINYVPNMLSALIVLVVGLLLANALKKMVVATCQSFGVTSAGLVGNFVFYFVFLTAMVAAIGQAKIDTDFVKNNLTVILGGAVGAFALGYGLASRDMMANFLGSMYSRRRFRVGDVIRIGTIVGRIAAMDNTSAVLNAPDRQIIVPLSKLMTESVEVLPNDFLQLPNE